MRLDDEGNHSGIIAARWETGWKRMRERDGRIDNRGRRTNPFNRESIYITDLPNNNSVSSAGWSRVIPRHLTICPSRTLAPLPVANFRDQYSTRMRAIQNFHPFHYIDRICTTSLPSVKRIPATPPAIKFQLPFNAQFPFAVFLCKS